MKKKLFLSSLLILLVLTGCSQKAPDIASSNNISDANAITGDTVSINESPYGNESGKNSSSDGFKSLYFSFGKYGISSQMQNDIYKNVSVANNTSAKIKIEGNCDEFGTDEYNYALGLKRAKAVKDSLISQGVNSSRIVIVSFGESNPVCSVSSDSCYAKNRRVDLRLVR
ncbi:Outer membrane lipoprotein omp16 precursor [hydrothermal vent metagenome]|uniref:Outer membrane lipoprotein omp16 n=1 Tax=hydrothermal vent metagenome TaxID=652676 RepID=A0A1W1EDA1_9ZZZZ